MDKLSSVSTAAPGIPNEIDAPPAKPSHRGASDAGPLRCRFVLVEDVDHLMRTGESRQVLAIRWVH